jgi:PTS system nitrogen regulatory IIA component
MKDVTEALGAFVQLQEGVSFDAIDDKPVDLAFALLVPESANEIHLQLLSQLASMFSDPGLRQDLRDAESATRILELLESRGNDAQEA